MRKWMIVGTMVLYLASGCSMETLNPDSKKETETEEEVVTEEPVFTPSIVTASYINVEAEKLNVRKDPDVDSEKLAEVYKNDKFQTIEEVYDTQKRIWYKIQAPSGVEGYVAGWFCAQTKITIEVNLDSAMIQEIEALPVPRYMDNPFQLKEVRVGDQIVGILVKEVSDLENMKKVVFGGEIILTGQFYHEVSTTSPEGQIRFVPDEASSVFLPRTSESIETVWFTISNYEQFKDRFGVVNTEGKCKITVDDYTMLEGLGNQAKVIDVEMQ